MPRSFSQPHPLRTAMTLLAELALLSSLPLSAALAQAPAQAVTEASLSPELEQARAVLEKYRDPVVAVHDGYLSTLACVEYTKGGEGTMHYAPGGMGVHFLNMQLIGRPLEVSKPQVLIYEPHGDSLELAAAEWFVPVEAAGQTRPRIFGQDLQGPMEGHVPLQPASFHHYDLHVWLWRHNPAGTFAPTNPAVKCPKRGYSFTERAPKLVDRSGH